MIITFPNFSDLNSIGQWFWLPLLYAETHYRFKYFISYLRKSEPEIIADCPSRLKKDHDLLVLIIIKDAHRYPVEMRAIDIYSGARLLFHQNLQRTVHNSYEEIFLEFPCRDLPVGTLPVNIRITYQINQKIMTCWNDNHRGSSHAPLPVYISEQDLPRLNNCLYGETHAHTIFSSDQVEFAASLETSAKMASFIGLDFLCATDHSYDLDDQPDNYLLHDPDLKKWHQFLQEVQQYNKQNTFQIIPGEEVTVRNRQNKNIHCLVYNSERFFHGSGDSAEKWLRTRSELSIPELLAELPPEACAFAAHPAEQPPFLQRILINRGHWQVEDCANDLLHGLQFLNHSGAAIDADGRSLWIRMLLGGFRLVGLAGNDAHGNFSRSRQIGIPFLTMRENYLHLFGYWRTGVYTADNRKDMPAILKSMRDGACFMTNGPALCLQAFDQNKWQHTGSRLTNITRIRLAAQSNKEFSEFKQARILMGLVGTKQEQSYFQHDFEPGQETYDIELDFLPQEKNGYFRAEVTTRSGKEALSNPIWF